MRYYSTNGTAPVVDLEQAILNGLAPDGGLYMPESLPDLRNEVEQWRKGCSFIEIATVMGQTLFSSMIPDDVIESITEEVYDFALPIIKLEKNLNILELFHGPTSAFKDVAALFMARLFGYIATKRSTSITILVATSGDTGGAVANGFYGLEGIDVVILYPSGGVSELQEKQIASMGRNVSALEVEGTFDDCQHLVKQAFLDADLRTKRTLASANSINIARLLPQSFYHMYCALQCKSGSQVFSVPSGNFGNITAGMIAKQMGAPIDHFVAATNKNDTVPRYLQTGRFEPKPSVATLSNAMDVGNPSNFARILDLYKDNLEAIQADVTGMRIEDDQTRQTIASVYRDHGYILDPHGAVAYAGLTEYLQSSPSATGVAFATAHPAKFMQTVEEQIGTSVPMPPQLATFEQRTKQATPIKNSFEALKEVLICS